MVFVLVWGVFLVVQASKRIILQEGIHDFVDYSRQNEMKSNSTNCKVMSLGSNERAVAY